MSLGPGPGQRSRAGATHRGHPVPRLYRSPRGLALTKVSAPSPHAAKGPTAPCPAPRALRFVPYTSCSAPCTVNSAPCVQHPLCAPCTLLCTISCTLHPALHPAQRLLPYFQPHGCCSHPGAVSAPVTITETQTLRPAPCTQPRHDPDDSQPLLRWVLAVPPTLLPPSTGPGTASAAERRGPTC